MKWHEHRFHEDARRRGFYDLVPGLSGDINFTQMYPGVICGMHMHQQQTDYFAVIKGSISIRLIYDDGRAEEKFVVSEHTHKTIIIPPGVWHGYKTLEPTILFFYIDKKFNMDDELRRPTVAEEWITEIK